jgi:hypothetical protein
MGFNSPFKVLKTKLRHVILVQFSQLDPSAAVLTVSKLFFKASIKMKILEFYPSAVATRLPSAAYLTRRNSPLSIVSLSDTNAPSKGEDKQTLYGNFQTFAVLWM